MYITHPFLTYKQYFYHKVFILFTQSCLLLINLVHMCTHRSLYVYFTKINAFGIKFYHNKIIANEIIVIILIKQELITYYRK